MIYRRLTQEEIARVPGVQTPVPKSFHAIGAVDDEGNVIAALGIFAAVHFDPLWVREDKRGSGIILRRLWEAVQRHLRDHDLGDVTVGMLDSNPGPRYESVVEKLCCKLAGGHEVKGRIFTIPFNGRHHDSERADG